LRDIESCGYFPAFVTDSISRAVGDEPVLSHLVHHEATFNRDAVGRHLTVLVLTASRLVIGHTDEGMIPGESPHAITSTESVRVAAIDAVAMSEMVTDPASYDPGSSLPQEAWLSIGWGTLRRIDVEPASCGDPNCEADHGYAGQLSSDDLTVRMSVAADGDSKVRQLLDFAAALQTLIR
jgi:hypothetical protein